MNWSCAWCANDVFDLIECAVWSNAHKSIDRLCDLNADVSVVIHDSQRDGLVAIANSDTTAGSQNQKSTIILNLFNGLYHAGTVS